MDEEPVAGEVSAPTAPAGEAEEAGASSAAGQARTADPWSDPRLPWEGKPRRVDILCWAAIMLSGLVG